MKNYKLQTKSGFTLIELLLYVAISSVMLLITSLFLQTLLQSRIKNQTIAEVEQQGLHIMQLITQTVRNAEAITAPAPSASAASLTLDVIPAASDPTVFVRISFTLTHVNPGGRNEYNFSKTFYASASLRQP
ncbi:MAG: hypothetical protein UW24_C0005G0002 [Parcubacteria group bacterium GW2011_GWA2_44_12]|nr:MAG: hypothetical protein UW24_C0005G0002 [Parcubacteria group bacterium GW2011_GWA2_44_12]